MVTIFVQKKK